MSNNTLKIVICVILLGILGVGLAGALKGKVNAGKLNRENYDKIQEGMSHSEVAEILGSSGKTMNVSIQGKMYNWTNEGTGAWIRITFSADDKLIEKNCNNLGN